MNKLHKVLIICDNPILANRFEKEVWPLVDSALFDLSFRCSPYSSISKFDLSNKISKIDLKNRDDVKTILDNNLIVSIHCKQLFPKYLINAVRCVNVHPGYNPINRGWYPQVFAIIENLEIGATIHEIDELLDHGKIIAREKVEKFQHDTSLSLYNRIVDKEIELLKSHIHKIINKSYIPITPESEGNLRLKKDFNELLHLNLDEKLTMGEAIDKLRALTHGKYKNAYFIDKNGNKIFVSLNLSNDGET